MNESCEREVRCPFSLGYPVVCLNVADLAASVDFYTRLGFIENGGDSADNWVVMSHPAVELRLFQGHLDGNALLFTDCDPVYPIVHIYKAALLDGPIPPVPYTSSHLPGADGEKDLHVTDPAGMGIYFIYCSGVDPPELAAEDIPAGLPSYGAFTWAVPLSDLTECLEFYTWLRFTIVEEDVAEDYKWIELTSIGDTPFRLCLCENVTPGQMLMFMGGDVYAMEEYMTANGLTPDIPAQLGNDGVDSMMIRDPDGNMVCFHGPQPEDQSPKA